MADNPLVKFWNDTLTQASADKTAADTQLKSAQDDLKSKKDAVAAATAKAKSALQKIADIRAKLAAIPTGDDGQALLEQFRRATLDAHAAQGALVTAQDALAQSTAASAAAAAAVGAAATRAAAASAALSEAKQQAGVRDALRDAAGRSPVNTLKADAAALAASATFTNAKKRIEADLPTPLLAAAEARFDEEQSRADRAVNGTAVADGLIASAGGKIASARLALAADLAQLQDTVQNGPNNLKQAATVFANVADPNQATLTADEVAAIKGLKSDGTPDDTINKPRQEAATAATTLAQKEKSLDDAQSAVDDARLNARAKGVDPGKIDDDPNVKTALTALDTAKSERDKADSDYTADQRKSTPSWAATVPDTNWQMLADYESAKHLLNELSVTDPAAQAGAVTAAETALVAALQDAAGAPLLLDAVRQESARRASLRDAAVDALPRRILSAVRDDF